MPRGDRTGPTGMGPMTGRAAGYCAGFDRPGFANPVGSRGYGMGFGRGFGGRGGGRGCRNMYYATGMPGWMRFGGYAAQMPVQNQASEVDALKAHAEALKEQLNSIQRRIGEIEHANSHKEQ